MLERTWHSRRALIVDFSAKLTQLHPLGNGDPRCAGRRDWCSRHGLGCLEFGQQVQQVDREQVVVLGPRRARAAHHSLWQRCRGRADVRWCQRPSRCEPANRGAPRRDEGRVQRDLSQHQHALGVQADRPDDQDEEKIRNRYQEYNEKTAPLMAYYHSQNKFYAVNGIGTIEEITERVSKVIDNL